MDEQLGIGSFVWAQLTYDTLRTSKRGKSEEEIAWHNCEDDMWYFTNDYANDHKVRKGPWSDIIIS